MMFPRSRNGPNGLVKAMTSAYDVVMKVIRSGQKEVVKFVTPSGVTAAVDTSISDAALGRFAKSLREKIKRSAERSARMGAKTK